MAETMMGALMEDGMEIEPIDVSTTEKALGPIALDTTTDAEGNIILDGEIAVKDPFILEQRVDTGDAMTEDELAKILDMTKKELSERNIPASATTTPTSYGPLGGYRDDVSDNDPTHW